jgi:hypothetical protein
LDVAHHQHDQLAQSLNTSDKFQEKKGEVWLYKHTYQLQQLIKKEISGEKFFFRSALNAC